MIGVSSASFAVIRNGTIPFKVHKNVSSLHLQVDGILCLADILTDDSHSEATRAEAAAVVAQVTSPHLSFTQHLTSFLENMEEIVTALISELSWVEWNLCVRGTQHNCLQEGPGRTSHLLLTKFTIVNDSYTS